MVNRRELLSTAASGTLVGSAIGFGVGRVRGAGKPPVSPNHDEYPFRRNDDRVQLVDADPEFGFNYPYYLAAPEDFRSEPVPLMVEMNNAGRGQDLDTLKDRVKDQITRFELQGPWLSEELGVPQLIPVVPWPDGDPVNRSHIPINLNRNAMLLEGTDLDRMDLQVLSMADHARQRVLIDHQMMRRLSSTAILRAEDSASEYLYCILKKSWRSHLEVSTDSLPYPWRSWEILP